MGTRYQFWWGISAVVLMLTLSSVVLAVTEADVVRFKDKVAQGVALTEEELHMAIKAEGLFGSQILQPEQHASEAPRHPNNPLDEYQFSTVDFEWIDITGTGTPAGITGDDQNVGPWDLGFSFSLYDQTFSSVRMCSNGWASFTSTSAVYFNGTIPAVAEPNNALYAFWDDLYPPTGGSFFYYADAANDRFIMSWIEVPHIGSTTELYTFQIVLYENGNIQYNYQSIPEGGVYGNSTCTVGIENSDGTEGLQVCYNGDGTLPTSETSILISQPDGVPVAPTGLTLDNTAGGIALSWVNPTEDTNGNPVTPDHVEVWRGNASPTELLATLAGTATTYTDANPVDGTRRYYVRSCSPTFCGASALGTVPVAVAPSGITATPGQNSATISWTDPALDDQGGTAIVTSVQVWIGPVGSGTLAGTVAGGVQTFNVTDLQSGNYTFNVRALSHVFSGAAGNVTTVVGNPSYFSDFEADDGQLVADAGWEWGTPTAVGPATAHSGTNCWGTLLGANYPNSACYNLDLNQELTVGSDQATMEFWMWRDCESFFDGMNIKVSTDGGATWTIVSDVTPIYEEDAFYTGTPCIASEIGWTGHGSISWIYYVVSLGDFVGTTPIIRFNFASDPSVQYPGFYIDDLTLWGFGEPEFASVSGSVTLDGGAGTMTSVQVRANGIGNPVTNPAANGAYSLPQVLVGNRVITGSLAGYHDAVANINLTSGGATNVNLTLVRVDPPVPTGLTGSVNNSTGQVTLDWDNSTDALVDVYPVYRRLSTEETWTLAGTPAASNFTETLTVDGIYLYGVAARDNGVSTPVESDMSPTITLLYGELPVTSIGTNGDFDDRIQISWLEPGITEGELISYDDGTSEIWYRVATPNGPNDYFCMRMSPPDDAAYPLMLYAATIYMERSDPLPWVALCPPNATNVGADIDNPLYVWENIGADSTPGWLYAETDGSVFLDAPGDFYIVIQFPPGGTGPGCGSDNSQPDSRTFWSNTYPTWSPFWAWDWMMRAWVGGPPPEGLLGGREQVIEIRSDGSPTGYAMDRIPQWTTVEPVFNSKNEKANLTARSEWELEHSLSRWFNGSLQPYSRAPEVTCTISREQGRSLDDLTNYRIYRQGTGQIAQVGAAVTTYQDLNRVENTPYTYWVTAVYDGTAESPESQHVTATCNMRPASPTALQANPMGNTQMVITWTAPTTNADGTNLVDLAGYRVYRDGTQIGTTAAGVTTYTDTPPEPNFFYEWTVAAVDEVPNVSDLSAGIIGAVVSPWEVVDYDWVDISGIGTPAGITGDDQNVGPFDLGFTFTYYGTDYTSIRMCSNGWASFTSTSTAYFNGTIPAAAEPNNALYVWWDDMYAPDGGEFYYYSDAANGRFIMSWVNVPHISNDLALYTYQIIIESSGGIIYNYQSMPTETPGVTSGTIGVENADGTDAIELLANGVGAFTPANETAVAFWAGPSGSIAGLVREFGNNSPIAGAEATVEEIPGELAITDAQGNYTLGVEPGTYTLRIHKQGYCDQIFENVVVDDGGTTTRNASMRQPNATFSVSTVNILTQVGQNAQGQFEITNPASTCEVVYSITTNQQWLTVNPASGEVNENQSQMITVTGATSAFAPGDYNATITVNHNDTNNPYTIPVTITVSLDADDNTAIPTEFALKSNYPNPFNATTALRFDVPAESRVQITLYNVAGQEVARPVDQLMPAGSHSVLYDAGNLPTGMYLVKMTAGEFSAVQKMLLLK